MTTNLVNRAPQRVPWDDDLWYFDPVEFRKLFPEDVVGWMERHPRELADRPRRSELHRAMMWPRRPLPAAHDLPVVVAARFSLSFPVLLSAVPLWRFDFDRPASTPEWQAEWDAWQGRERRRLAVPAERRLAPRLAARRHPGAAEPRAVLVLRRRDLEQLPAPLLRSAAAARPTFAINLTAVPPGEKPDQENQMNNVRWRRRTSTASWTGGTPARAKPRLWSRTTACPNS